MAIDSTQEIQANQYHFPYHYIPEIYADTPSFAASRKWNFSKSYAVALVLVKQWLQKGDSLSTKLIDIGCGDGGFLYHLKKYSIADLLCGVDYDDVAIKWARAFNSDIKFYCGNITEGSVVELVDCQGFDTATLIEVIEHIPPSELPAFISASSKLLKPRGALLVTVPHQNKPLAKKHFQHFSFSSLSAVLSSDFDVEEIYGFETKSFIETFFQRVLQNRFLYCEIPRLNRLFMRMQLSRVSRHEENCGRIFAVCRRKD